MIVANHEVWCTGKERFIISSERITITDSNGNILDDGLDAGVVNVVCESCGAKAWSEKG